MVRLEACLGISGLPGSREPGRVVREEGIQGRTTVGDLLKKIANQYPAFDNALFDPTTGLLSDRINIAVNGQVSREALGIVLVDGDTVTLLPFIDGG